MNAQTRTLHASTPSRCTLPVNNTSVTGLEVPPARPRRHRSWIAIWSGSCPQTCVDKLPSTPSYGWDHLHENLIRSGNAEDIAMPPTTAGSAQRNTPMTNTKRSDSKSLGAKYEPYISDFAEERTSLTASRRKSDASGPQIVIFEVQRRPRAIRASVPKVRSGCITCKCVLSISSVHARSIAQFRLRSGSLRASSLAHSRQ